MQQVCKINKGLDLSRPKTTLLALALMKGIQTPTIANVIRLYMLLTYPYRSIFQFFFGKRMIQLYATVGTFVFLKIHLTKIVLFLLRSFDKQHRELWHIRKTINNISNANEWKLLAKLYDEKSKILFGSNRGLDANLYAKELLIRKIQNETHCENKDIKDFMGTIRLDLTRNYGNIAKNKLHEYYTSVPNTILKYIDKVKYDLKYIAEYEKSDLSKTEKMTFFRETRHTYGRTALLLSGGASLGTFHMGVIKALFEHGLLPRIIAGSSVGAIVGSIIAVRTNDELASTFQHIDKLDIGFFSENQTIKLLMNVLSKGHAHDDKHLIEKLRGILGDYTFKEAYDKTGRIMNISVSPTDLMETPKVLNYLTAPNVLIWSAVAASTAMPGLFPAQCIYTKDTQGNFIPITLDRQWIDGSLQMDLPVSTLTEMFNCNYFLVSQCNPHIVPILNTKRMTNSYLFKVFETEFKHRCQQIQMLSPKWLPTKWLDLFTQCWEGDVTFALPISFYNPRKLVTNPSVQDVLNSVKLGERTVWENLWVIECNCSIEIFLDEQVRNLCGGEASWGIYNVTSRNNLLDLERLHTTWTNRFHESTSGEALDVISL
jgi:TAG lipase/steryl ester hydrolase/phospholipase A2/LPA acyltransferase